MTTLPLSFSPPSRRVPRGPGVRTIAGAIGTAVTHLRRLGEAWTHRHEAAALAGFSDRMLSDIGLSRSDLRDAYAEPPWRDPTALLADRAGDRRRWRRGPGGLAPVPRVTAGPPLVPSDDACAAGHPTAPTR